MGINRPKATGVGVRWGGWGERRDSNRGEDSYVWRAARVLLKGNKTAVLWVKDQAKMLQRYSAAIPQWLAASLYSHRRRNGKKLEACLITH